MQPRKVFLSYRREDSAAAAGRLSDRLVAELGDGNVFMDVDGIALGADFVKRLIEEVACCDTLLAVIGPRWLDVVDEAGDRRLDDPNDFVRVEIAAALQRDIPVIPILLDGTKIPRVDRLPPDLKHLSRRNGLDVRQASFHSDVGRLIRELKATAPATTNPSVSKVETDRTDQNMISSDAVARSEPPARAASHSDRLSGELEATDTRTVADQTRQNTISTAASSLSAPDPATGDQGPKPTLANPVKRCVYGTLLGSPIGVFICFVIVSSTLSVHSSLEDWIIVFGLLVVGSIGLVTIGRRLINMGIFKASIISACFATVLSAGISLGIFRAAGVQHSMDPVFLWPFVLLAIQGLFLAARLRLRRE